MSPARRGSLGGRGNVEVGRPIRERGQRAPTAGMPESLTRTPTQGTILVPDCTYLTRRQRYRPYNMRFSRLSTTCLPLLALLSCGGGGGSSTPQARPVTSLTIDPVSGLSVSLVDGRHVFRTLVAVRGVEVNASTATPLEADDYTTEMLIDGAPISSENLISENEIAAELLVSLVLDASYSMVNDHSPSAFAPMLAAARSSLTRIQNQWKARSGDSYSSWIWFDDYIYDPYAGSDYATSNIVKIPRPQPGTDTRLYGAIEFMADRHEQLRQGTGSQAPIADGPIDRHVMIVFTDGRDNRSGFVTTPLQSYIPTPFPHERLRPGQATSLSSLETRLEQLPFLTLFVIGFGSDVESEVLRSIANSRQGIYVESSSTASIQTLFDSISREIGALRQFGARKSEPLVGPHTFSIRARSVRDPSVTTVLDIPFTGQSPP